MFGALVYALFGLRMFLSSIATLLGSLRETFARETGGMAFYAFGIDVFFAPIALLAIASIVVSVMLATWARSAGSTVKALHRTQRWSLMLAFAVLLAMPVVMRFDLIPTPPSPIVMFSLNGVLWGAQFVLTAALLGLYAARSS